MTEVIAHFRLVHLQQVFKQLAEGEDGLGVGGDGVQVAEVFAVQSSENIVTVFLLLRDETNRSEVSTKSFNGNNSAWWVGSDNFI